MSFYEHKYVSTVKELTKSTFYHQGGHCMVTEVTLRNELHIDQLLFLFNIKAYSSDIVW